jgi:hypothetical protein
MPGSRSKKVQYKRSTPVIRLQRNIAKLERNAGLILNRLSSWLTEGDQTLVKSVEHIARIMQSIDDLRVEVDALVGSDFVPPKRSAAAVFVEGQTVAIAPKYRKKYVQAFKSVLEDDPDFLDALVIKSIIETGEITVQRGKKTPFIVRKSHIVPV